MEVQFLGRKTYPDFSKPFEVVTDASSPAVGVLLSQIEKIPRKHQIHYPSTNQNDEEMNNSTHEIEGLATVFALKKFAASSLMSKFQVVSRS